MGIIETVVGCYGWEGIALMIVILAMLSVQIYYYAFKYGRIASYKNNNRALIMEHEPPVSVIIPMFSEDGSFIEESLPLFLSQDYPNFEIVLVYVGHDNDFYEDLTLLKHSFPQITTTKIHLDSRFPISRKMALNIGIKSARNEHMIFSSTDAVLSSSRRWLSLMVKGFMRGEVVLGYSNFERSGGAVNYIMRAWSFMSSVNWLSCAISSHAYQGSICNIGITKSLYFSSKGFNYLQMNIGENDLFMQKVMTKDNVSVIISPRARVAERVRGDYNWWVSTLSYFGSAFVLYPSSVKSFIRWELGSRILFFITTICAMVIMPIEYKLIALLLLVVRYIIVVAHVHRISKRLGERGIAKLYFIFDILSLFYEAMLWIKLRRKDVRVWR